MTARHTIRHAIQYLHVAKREQRECFMSITDTDALTLVDPLKPCAAYGVARRTLRRCGSLSAAITDLQRQSEQS